MEGIHPVISSATALLAIGLVTPAKHKPSVAAVLQDNQVPVCPLCNCPVPLGATGSLPDEVVGRHIDNDCQSETAQSRRKVCMHRYD